MSQMNRLKTDTQRDNKISSLEKSNIILSQAPRRESLNIFCTVYGSFLSKMKVMTVSVVEIMFHGTDDEKSWFRFV